MPCTKTDCKYRGSNKFENGSCNYLFITGTSKLAQIPKGQKYDVRKCQFYEPGRKINPPKVNPTVTPNTTTTKNGVARIEQFDNAVDFYDANLSDTDMAMVFGVSIQAVSAWRHKHSLLMKKEKLSHIDWNDVDQMIDEGYSIVAIARFHNTKEFVINQYIELKTKGIRNVLQEN